ncbi:MAG: hypothetical protein OXC08_12145 [Thiotrichales bacterium]|nr:hypothetical protein [Thiotrichales bacterium]
MATTDDDWAPFPSVEAEQRYMAEYARKLDRTSRQRPTETTMQTDRLSPVERDVHRGHVVAFMARCAERGVPMRDIERALDIYARLTLDLEKVPNLQVREAEHH